MDKKTVFNLLTNTKFGIPSKNIKRVKPLSLTDYQYICPDVFPEELHSEAFKNAFLKFHELCTNHQYLVFKYNHNEACYYFDTEEFYLTYLTNIDLISLKNYMNKNDVENESSWSDIFIFNGQIGSYRFKKIYKDGYYHVMINIVYVSDGSKDYVKITEKDKIFKLDYEINVFFKNNLFYIFDEYNNNGIFKHIMDNFNNQIKLMNYIYNDVFTSFHAKKNMVIKLKIEVDINTDGTLLNHQYYLLMKKGDNKLLAGNDINPSSDEKFIPDADGFMTSQFFEKITEKLNVKYNMIIDTSTKEAFNNTLALLEMIEY